MMIGVLTACGEDADDSGDSKTIIVDRDGDGRITVTYSPDGVVTTSVDGDDVTITGVGAGTAIVTINVAESDTYKSTSTTMTVTVSESGVSSKTTPNVPIVKVGGIALGTSLDLGSGASKTVSVERDGTGEITAVSSSPGVVTVSVSDTDITVVGVAAGTATITVNISEDATYEATSTTFNVNVSESIKGTPTSGPTLSSTGTESVGSGFTNTIGVGYDTIVRITDLGDSDSLGGAVAESSDESIVTAEISGTDLIIHGVSAGTATIEVYVKGDETNNDSPKATYTANVQSLAFGNAVRSIPIGGIIRAGGIWHNGEVALDAEVRVEETGKFTIYKIDQLKQLLSKYKFVNAEIIKQLLFV